MYALHCFYVSMSLGGGVLMLSRDTLDCKVHMYPLKVTGFNSWHWPPFSVSVRLIY